MTEIIIAIIAIIISLLGIAGCILPILPGPLISYGSLLMVKFATDTQISNQILIIFGLTTAIVTVADTVLPIYMPKRFGSSALGVIGATIGLIAGLFFPPFGFIIGPFIGALLFEYFKKKNAAEAFVAGIGSFFGFMVGTVLKIALSITITAYLVIKVLIPLIAAV